MYVPKWKYLLCLSCVCLLGVLSHCGPETNNTEEVAQEKQPDASTVQDTPIIDKVDLRAFCRGVANDLKDNLKDKQGCQKDEDCELQQIKPADGCDCYEFVLAHTKGKYDALKEDITTYLDKGCYLFKQFAGACAIGPASPACVEGVCKVQYTNINCFGRPEPTEEVSPEPTPPEEKAGEQIAQEPNTEMSEEKSTTDKVERLTEGSVERVSDVIRDGGSAPEEPVREGKKD